VLSKYLRALDRAEDALESNHEKFLPLWNLSIPPEFQDGRWDFSKFSRGERFVYEPVSKAEFDQVLSQVERWGLDQHLKEWQFEKLIPAAAT
jgi:hypothetical protein